MSGDGIVSLVSPMERGEEPARDASERDLLLAWLEWHRATMAKKCEGLEEAQLGQRSCLPSELTLLGLVRHLTEIERNYFAAWAGVTDLPHYYSDADPDGDFHLPDPVTDDVVGQAFDAWRAECDRSRRIVAEADSVDEANVKGLPAALGAGLCAARVRPPQWSRRSAARGD